MKSTSNYKGIISKLHWYVYYLTIHNARNPPNPADINAEKHNEVTSIKKQCLKQNIIIYLGRKFVNCFHNRVRNAPGGLILGTRAAKGGPILRGAVERSPPTCHGVTMARDHPPAPLSGDRGWPWFPAPGLILTPTRGPTARPSLSPSLSPGRCWMPRAVPQCPLEIGVRRNMMLHVPLFSNSAEIDLI